MQAHGQVDYLLKSKNQMSNMILKRTMSSQRPYHVNYNKLKQMEYQDKVKEKSRARFCNNLQSSVSNAEKVNRRSSSSVTSQRGHQVVVHDNQDLSHLREDNDNTLFVTPEDRSRTKRGKKSSRMKKSRVEKDDHTFSSTNDSSYVQDDQVVGNNMWRPNIGEDASDYYDNFSTNSFSHDFGLL